MVKYGKTYRKIQTEEWKKYYLDYKLLKKKIKEIKENLGHSLRKNTKASRSSLLLTPLVPDDDIENESFNLYQEENGKYLKEFIDLLLKEFHKSYNFYIKIENVLVKKMNIHLCTQTKYSNYNLEELTKEMKSLTLTVFLTKSLNDFANDIMTALKKILKKFDKNFYKIYGIITPLFILKLLSKKNSPLEYMQQFRIIDQIGVIAENSAKELKKYFDQNIEQNNLESFEYRNTFISKYEETIKYINSIDEIIYFRTQDKNWKDYITTENKRKLNIKHIENDIFNPILSSAYYKDNQLDKFLSTKQAFDDLKNIQKPLSSVNKVNIVLIFIHSFFYNSQITNIFPALYFYEYLCAEHNHFFLLSILVFTAISVLYFGQYLSVLLFYDCVSINNIKSCYNISYILFLCGSLVYIFSVFYSLEEQHYKLRAFILGSSRFIIGLGSNQMQGKRYITLYTPKYFLPLLSKIYLIIELAGFILGPTLTALFCFLHYDKYICIFNCLGYYGALVSFIMLLLHIFLFRSPKDPNFSTTIDKDKIIINNNEDNVTNISLDKFEEDDSEDKEFYKLQKEANEKKQKDLEIKNDDLIIEINRKDISKSTIKSHIKSRSEFIMDKEKDDTIQKKIFEDDSDIIDNKGMKEKVLNNMDFGEFSNDIIASKDEIDTITDLENKLFEYQEKSNFTNVDMMPRTIEDIINRESKRFGYINRNYFKIFWLLFFNSFIKENLIIYTSYEILFSHYNLDEKFKEKKEKETILAFSQSLRVSVQIICLMISAELFLQIFAILFIMPFFRVNLIFKKHLLISMILSIACMAPLSFDIPVLAYISIVSIDIFFHKIIEVLCSCYLVYLIPPNWKFAHLRASSLIVHVMTFGKIFSCLLCFTFFNEKEDKKIRKINIYSLTLIAFCSYISIIIIIFKSKSFRVKAIIRILTKKLGE